MGREQAFDLPPPSALISVCASPAGMASPTSSPPGESRCPLACSGRSVARTTPRWHAQRDRGQMARAAACPPLTAPPPPTPPAGERAAPRPAKPSPDLHFIRVRTLPGTCTAWYQVLPRVACCRLCSPPGQRTAPPGAGPQAYPLLPAAAGACAAGAARGPACPWPAAADGGGGSRRHIRRCGGDAAAHAAATRCAFLPIRLQRACLLLPCSACCRRSALPGAANHSREFGATLRQALPSSLVRPSPHDASCAAAAARCLRFFRPHRAGMHPHGCSACTILELLPCLACNL